MVGGRRVLGIVLAAALALGVARPAFAGDVKPRHPFVTFHPSIEDRILFELLPDRNLYDPWSYTEIANRARVGLEARFGPNLSVFAQAQDVRAWGSMYGESEVVHEGWYGYEDITTGLDMRQVYVELDLGTGHDLRLRVGRQVIDWHSGRLIGSEPWSHGGRSFDTVRLDVEPGAAGFEVLYSLLLDREGEWDRHMVAVRGGPRLSHPLESDALELDALLIVLGDLYQEFEHATFGIHGQGRAGPLRLELEAYGQAGAMPPDKTYQGWLVGLRMGAGFGDSEENDQLYVGGGLDLVSGQDWHSHEHEEAFRSLYGSEYAFHGRVNMFQSGPDGDVDDGLIDTLLELRFTPESVVDLRIDLHQFHALEEDDERFEGVELDLDSRWMVDRPLPVQRHVEQRAQDVVALGQRLAGHLLDHDRLLHESEVHVALQRCQLQQGLTHVRVGHQTVDRMAVQWVHVHLLDLHVALLVRIVGVGRPQQPLPQGQTRHHVAHIEAEQPHGLQRGGASDDHVQPMAGRVVRSSSREHVHVDRVVESVGEQTGPGITRPAPLAGIETRQPRQPARLDRLLADRTGRHGISRSGRCPYRTLVRRLSDG